MFSPPPGLNLNPLPGQTRLVPKLPPKEEPVIKKASLPLFTVFLALAAVLLWNQQDRGRHLPAYGGITYQHTREQLAASYPGFFFYSGPRNAKKVALTFDDGPDDQVTPQVLDILKENSVRGTFFLIGINARLHPDIARRIAAEGNIIGNHSWSHPNMARLGHAQARQEIEKTENLLERLTGHRTALIRLPWGAGTAGVMGLVKKGGYRVIGWSVDSFDWRDPGSASVLASLNAQVHPGAIVLMHAVGFPRSKKVTLKVLPVLIRELKGQGYQFVTVDELLNIPAYHPARYTYQTAHGRPGISRLISAPPPAFPARPAGKTTLPSPEVFPTPKNFFI